MRVVLPLDAAVPEREVRKRWLLKSRLQEDPNWEWHGAARRVSQLFQRVDAIDHLTCAVYKDQITFGIRCYGRRSPRSTT